MADSVVVGGRADDVDGPPSHLTPSSMHSARFNLPEDVSYCWLQDDPAHYERYRSVLSDAERERLQTFRAEKRRQEFTLGRAAARQLLSTRLDLPPAQVPLSVADDGALVVDDASYHVSISHTARQAVAAVARRPVGIDLEGIKPLRSNIRRYIFHEDDYALFDTLPLDPDRAQILAWALKEAALKARRSGLLYSPRRLRVQLSLADGTACLLEDTGAAWNASFCEVDGLYLAIAYRPD